MTSCTAETLVQKECMFLMDANNFSDNAQHLQQLHTTRFTCGYFLPATSNEKSVLPSEAPLSLLTGPDRFTLTSTHSVL